MDETFEIMTKARKHYAPQPTGMFARIGVEDGRKFILLTGTYSNSVVNIRFFEGDTAEYDSYNLSYLGKITKITEKCVTIDPKYNERQRRLSLHEFGWRNHNFDLERIEKENHETSMCI